MSFFSDFAEITNRELPDPSSLDTDQKASLAYQLVLAGESKVAIAKYMSCSRKYVYDLLDKAKNDRLDDLECKTYLSIFADTLFEIEEEIQKYRKLQDDVLNKCYADKTDDDGNPVKKSSSNRELVDYGRLIKDYQKMAIELKIKVGFIPTEDQTDLFGTIGDKNPENNADDREMDELNDEEVMQMLLRRLQSKPSEVTESKLKKMQNENIL